MRLSSKTGIGIRALFDMAFHCRGRQARAQEIARRQHIPVRTLEEVLQNLRRSGLIGAQRGRRGGYVLARAADQITVSQIVRALEGPGPGPGPVVTPTVLAAGGNGAREAGTAAELAADLAADVPALIWGDIAGRIAGVLDSTTLGDFVARAESVGLKRAVAEPTMYFI